MAPKMTIVQLMVSPFSVTFVVSAKEDHIHFRAMRFSMALLMLLNLLPCLVQSSCARVAARRMYRDRVSPDDRDDSSHHNFVR
jgi:hypothetical protein